MADEPTTPPATESAQTGELTPGNAGSTPPTPPAASPWDGPYDEGRATRLIENLRAELAEVKAKRSTPPADDVKAQFAELTAELAKTRNEAIEAAKRAAIADAKVPAHLAGYVSGKTPEEIKASAEKVAADFAAGETTTDPLPGLPKPRLTPGRAAADADSHDFDAAAVARAARGY
ncbi:hypothetical protein OG792_32805 [Micromonospora sp. NBC_01699]|uniref:hypothetical protein n=1 Tax=Micromonospora sp. NBC_01699 TaxID=2975984 RepID=UPI002E28FC13|nr:hypothetical protein [Micromonospora sp. NBC_01699]